MGRLKEYREDSEYAPLRHLTLCILLQIEGRGAARVQARHRGQRHASESQIDAALLKTQPFVFPSCDFNILGRFQSRRAPEAI